jgi:hypothetical protein
MTERALPASTVSIPLTTRMGMEIPKPKDWQTYQRNCVELFRHELNDPNAQEFGRSGQDQGGIDLLACRGGNTKHYVGVQCRLIAKPLKKKEILSDARNALALNLGLKELIFATSAPDDVKATAAALEVERELAAEGHDLRVVVFGWEHIQKLICRHDSVYVLWHPSIAAISAPIPSRDTEADERAQLASAIAAQVVERMRAANTVSPPLETSPAETSEDPPLHARIDVLRDLFKDQGLVLPAQKGLEELLLQDLSAKPWARFRIETILASIEIDLGKEKEAAKRFRFAFTLQPTNAKAIANLALAETIDAQYADAMVTAGKALASSPPEEHAVAVMLQAAARSGWKGDPLDLVPPNLRGTLAADFGLADFARRTEAPGWQHRCIELAARHPGRREFKVIRATAVLGLVVENPERPTVTADQVASAAVALREIATHCLDNGFADRDDLMAYINNAALLLRFCDRHKESEELLVRGIAVCGGDPQLRRLLAIAQFNQQRTQDAIQTLANDNDPENVLLRAQLLSTIADHKTALSLVQSIAEADLAPRLKPFRLMLLGEIGLATLDWVLIDQVIGQLHDTAPDELASELLSVRKLRRQTQDRKAVQEALLRLIARVSDGTGAVTRFDVAHEAYTLDLPAAAADLLEKHIDLQQPDPPTFLYLESLATARRDTALRAALARCSDDVRNDPRLQWVVAANAWNRGDLEASASALELVLSRQPNHARARLLKIDILMRQDKSSAVRAELAADLERLPWDNARDQFRLAGLLNDFGYADRAAALAYRLFLKHRDLSRAWMALSGIVLNVGKSRNDTLWHIDVIGPDAAVDLVYDDGSTHFFVIENETELRNLDESSWEPSHKLAAAIRGLKKESRFVGPDGREGKVANVRHKYVARLHYVLQNYETRFPTIFGVKQVAVDPAVEGGLNNIIAELQTRRDFIAEQAERYSNGLWTLEAFAKQVGVDPLDAAAGLVANGRKLKVAIGTVDERDYASQSIKDNGRRGCVLDLATFWTAHRLRVLDALKDTCGLIHVPQSVVDHLRLRRDHLADGAAEGRSSATLVDGKFTIVKTPPEQIVAARADIDAALQWLNDNASVRPMDVSDDLPAELRDILRKDEHALLDAVILAVQHKLLLVSDDLPLRQLAQSLGARGCWLHAALMQAANANRLEFDKYVRSSADLALAGHNFLSVTGEVVVRAAKMDAETGPSPGPLATALAGLLGGKIADRRSHTIVALKSLSLLWSDSETHAYRRPVASLVLRSVTRERVADCLDMLDDIEAAASQLIAADLADYIRAWRTGHFLTRRQEP